LASEFFNSCITRPSIRSSAVSGVIADLIGGIVAVLLDLRAIVNVEALRLYAGRADKLDLLGFVVVQVAGRSRV